MRLVVLFTLYLSTTRILFKMATTHLPLFPLHRPIGIEANTPKNEMKTHHRKQTTTQIEATKSFFSTKTPVCRHTLCHAAYKRTALCGVFYTN